MSIKIKRDMNAGAAAAASRAGGRGKKAIEDAQILASLAHRQGGGSTTGAQAQAHAQLVSAPTGGAAPLGSVGGQAHASPRRYGSVSQAPVTSPGGFKKGMRGSTAESGIASGGQQVGNLFVNESTGDVELRDGRGEVVRRYSKDQFDYLKRRGRAGATMDETDQQAWFRYNGGKTKQEIADEERQRKADEIAERRQREDEVFKRNNEEYDRRFQMESDARAVAERDRFEREEMRRAQEEERRNQEKLSARAQAERDKAAEDVIQGIKEGRFDDSEIPQLMEEFKEYEDRIKVADQLRRKPPTAQEQFDERRVTVNGKEGYIGARGDFIPFDDGSEAERELRKQELEQAKEEKRQAQRNAYILKSVEAAQKEWMSNDLTKRTPFDMDKAIENAGARYDKVFGVSKPKEDESVVTEGSQTNPPPAQPTEQPPPTPEKRKEKWLNFAD